MAKKKTYDQESAASTEISIYELLDELKALENDQSTESYKLQKRVLASLKSQADLLSEMQQQGLDVSISRDSVKQIQKAIKDGVNPRAKKMDDLEKAKAWSSMTHRLGKIWEESKKTLDERTGGTRETTKKERLKLMGQGVISSVGGGKGIAQKSAVVAMHTLGFMLKSPIMNVWASKMGAKFEKQNEANRQLEEMHAEDRLDRMGVSKPVGADQSVISRESDLQSTGTGQPTDRQNLSADSNESSLSKLDEIRETVEVTSSVLNDKSEEIRAAVENLDVSKQTPAAPQVKEGEREHELWAKEKADDGRHRESVAKLDEINRSVLSLRQKVAAVGGNARRGGLGPVARSPLSAQVPLARLVRPSISTGQSGAAEQQKAEGGGILSTIANVAETVTGAKAAWSLGKSVFGGGAAGAAVTKGKSALTAGGLGFKGAGSALSAAKVTGGFGGVAKTLGSAALGKGLLGKIPLIGSVIGGGVEAYDSVKSGEGTGTAVGKGLMTGGGALLGTALGGLVGGPLGAMAGGWLGEKAGSWGGKMLLGDKKAGKEGALSKIGSFFSPNEAAAADLPPEMKQAAKDVSSASKATAAAMPVIATSQKAQGAEAAESKEDSKQAELGKITEATKDATAATAGLTGSATPERSIADRMVNPFTGTGLMSTVGNALWKLSPIGMAGTVAKGAGALYDRVTGKGGKAATFDPSSLNGQKLGTVSAMFEGGKGSQGYATVSNTTGDAGGASYGKYQYSAASGGLSAFLNATGYSKNFKGVKPGTKEFEARWQQMAQDPKFNQAQDDYAVKKYYGGQLGMVKQDLGVDLSGRGRSVQEALMSTGVQYGDMRIASQALKGMDVSKMSDEDIVNAIQDRKARGVFSGDFKSSSADVQKSVAKRIEDERGVLNKIARAGTNVDGIKSDGKTAYNNAETTELARRSAKSSKQQPQVVAVNAGGGQQQNNSTQRNFNPKITTGDTETFSGGLYRAFFAS